MQWNSNNDRVEVAGAAVNRAGRSFSPKRVLPVLAFLGIVCGVLVGIFYEDLWYWYLKSTTDGGDVVESAWIETEDAFRAYRKTRDIRAIAVWIDSGYFDGGPALAEGNRSLGWALRRPDLFEEIVDSLDEARAGKLIHLVMFTIGDVQAHSKFMRTFGKSESARIRTMPAGLPESIGEYD